MNKNIALIFICSVGIVHASDTDEITPFKFIKADWVLLYDIPPSSRFTVPRAEVDAPDIVYYFSKPAASNYPIAVLCGEYSGRAIMLSMVHFHRHLLQEFKDLGAAVLTVEQWGIDGNTFDQDLLMEHYTRSQRLQDHQDVIEHLKSNPPVGWNGKFIFLGVYHAGRLATSLTTHYPDITLATINWVGAGGWSWEDELWAFFEGMRKDAPWWIKLWDLMPRWFPFAFHVPKTRREHSLIMNRMRENPCTDKTFMGLTYKYHADALSYPQPEYNAIHTPFLVIAGAGYSEIQSFDAFVEKARAAGVPITYMRVLNIGRDIFERPEIMQQSFDWLAEQIHSSRKKEFME